jgi:hypothetical protein
MKKSQAISRNSLKFLARQQAPSQSGLSDKSFPNVPLRCQSAKRHPR